MQISGSLAGEYCGMILQSLLHFCLLAGQLRTARTGFFPLFSLAPPEMIPEVDDLMLRGFHQMMENTLADEDLVSSLDELIENTIEEEEEEEEEEGEEGDDMTVDGRAVAAVDVLHRCAEHQHCSLPYSVVQ